MEEEQEESTEINNNNNNNLILSNYQLNSSSNAMKVISIDLSMS